LSLSSLYVTTARQTFRQ